jgi:hypothetical protein
MPSGIFRPSAKGSTGGLGYLGFKEINFLNLTVPDPVPEWADIYWNIECEINGSQYTNTLRVSGSFNKNKQGELVECGLLTRLYYFLDAIGFKGGLNIQGEWVDEAGNPIPDPVALINCDYMKKEGASGFSHYAYIFKEAPKKDGDKPYTKIQSKVVPNVPIQRKDLELYIKFMKEKGHLKEAREETSSASAPSEKLPF